MNKTNQRTGIINIRRTIYIRKAGQGLLDIATMYMILGIGAISVFQSMAEEQKATKLALLLEILYYFFIIVILLIILYQVFLMKKLNRELSIIFLVLFIFSSIFFVTRPGYDDIYIHFIYRKFLKHGFVLYILLRLRPDYEKVVHYCVIVARIAVLIYSYFLFFSVLKIGDSYLTVSEALGISVMVLFASAVYSGRIIDYIISIIGMIAMTLFGDRAHVVCLVIFVLFLLIKRMPNNIHSSRFRVLFTLFIFIVVALLINYLDRFLLAISLFLDRVGLDSRNLLYVFNNRIGDLSGRDYFYKNIIDAVKNNPLGHGLLGDVILNYEKHVTSIITGAYAHNGYLESICEFGIFVGTAIWIWIIFGTIKVLRTNNNKNYTILFSSLFGSGIVILVFSYSYWISIPFWGFIALLINNYEDSKENTKWRGKGEVE